MKCCVVLCTCNGERFLAEQWRSLLGQTRLPDAIVARDDASGDGTWSLLQTLRADAEQRGVRVDLQRQSRNLGVVANFEAALAAADGDIVFLCDQDDVWHPDKIATVLAEFARRPTLTLLHSNARLIDADGAPLRHTLFRVLEVSRRERARLHDGRAFDALLRRNLATGATIALRRSLLADARPFPPEWVHDEWLAIVAAALGEVDCVESPLIEYRQHGGNQIGASRRDLAGKLARAGMPRQAFLSGLTRRTAALIERLRSFGARVAPERVAAAQRKLEHLDRRLKLPASRPRRVLPVLREAAAGRYARYSMGLRAVAFDLLGTN